MDAINNVFNGVVSLGKGGFVTVSNLASDLYNSKDLTTGWEKFRKETETCMNKEGAKMEDYIRCMKKKG